MVATLFEHYLQYYVKENYLEIESDSAINYFFIRSVQDIIATEPYLYIYT